jgi:hypothetical protein
VLHEAALYGLPGHLVRSIEPYTEADPAGLLLTYLAMLGSAIGPQPAAVADGALHPARLNVLLAGDTARARKGSTQANIDRIMAVAAPEWFAACHQSGFGSGEGLIFSAAETGTVLVVEGEFAGILAVTRRPGGTLSRVIRDAWDGRTLRINTKREALAVQARMSV